MMRIGRLNLTLLTLLLLPAAVFAQEDTRQTEEASKYIGIAMTKQTPEERAEMYRQAMTHLREGMTADAENAKVWLLAGTALAALGEMTEADQAFDRALELHPEYAEQVTAERESAWMQAFSDGMQQMDQQQYPEAIATLEGAQLIYDARPEALMNLGALYANSGEPAKAEQALTQAIAATHGPIFAKLDTTQQAEWVRFRSMAAANIAQIQAQAGIASFQAEQFDSAAARFERAAEQNPQARDYWYNYGQALWALSSPIEEALATATAADSARIRGELAPLYAGIQTAAQKAREFDPNNEVLYLMEARTHRMSGALDDAAREAGQQAALALLQARDALTVTLEEVYAQQDQATGVTIKGVLKNLKATEGTPITLHFTLLDLEGNAIGTQDITVTTPAVDATAAFEATTTATGEVAGWKYAVN